MAKGFWKIGGKPVSPIVWGAAAFGIYFAIKKWAEKRAEKTAAEGLARLFEPTSGAVVPPGKRWIVYLKNGQTVEMTSIQLQNAIDAKGVKSYRAAAQQV